MIEIIARPTCPTCGGTGHVTCQDLQSRGVIVDWCYDSDCVECPEPVVVASFADQEALRQAVVSALEDLHGVGEYGAEDEAAAVLEALGVTHDDR